MTTAKVDNNRGDSSFGSKRSRNDVKDGDWTCTQCGNVNFSFRIVCNRSLCGFSRPSASPSHGLVPAPVPVPFRYEQERPNSYYSGTAHTPVGTYAAQPPVNGYAPGHAELLYQHLNMRYGYPPPPYGTSGSYVPYSTFAGAGYGQGAYLSRFGFGYRGSPMMGTNLWSGALVPANNDNNASRKRRGGPDGSADGDWVCPKCENRNFAFRTTCNMKKCGAPRPTEYGLNNSNVKKEQGEVPEGSWTCTNCNNLNYPFRTVCNRKGCGNERPAPTNSN